jgi:hypothetical protein
MPLKPEEINQLNVVAFQTNFTRLPNVNFFCQQVTIPSLSIGVVTQPTPFSDISVEGDKVAFEQLNLSFYVSEDLSNYLEIYNWIISLGFPDNPPQFNLQDDITTSTNSNETLKSDMNVILQTNKSNPNFNVVFKNAFPVSLGSIGLDSSATSLEPIVVEATFAYSGSFSIDKIT